MKSYKEFITEAKGNQYIVTVKIDGKTVKNQEMGYEQAKSLFQDATVLAGVDPRDIDKMFKTVDGGKPQGFKIENREMNIQLKK